MADIIAIKTVNGRVLKQRFNERAWKLLGEDKNGWQEATPQTIQNVIESQKASTSKEQKIENSIKPSVESNPVVNSVNQNAGQQDAAMKEKFMKAIEGFGKGNIKDYFDSQEPAIEYNNKATLADLKNQLAEHLKYDVIELQKIFS